MKKFLKLAFCLVYFSSFFNLNFAALPTQSACGTQSVSPSITGSSLNKRIINGGQATANSWPWTVSIRRYIGNGISTHFCGGTLIYEDLVLTAAHCVGSILASELVVIVGINDVSTLPGVSKIFLVSDRYYNPSYNEDDVQYGGDTAILKLASSVTLGNDISLACLPSSSDFGSVLSKNLVTAGWGSTTGANSPSALSPTLKQATLKVLNGQGQCNNFNFASSLIYCVLDVTGGQANVCNGDSGGPVLYFTNSKWYVYGIVSFVLIKNDDLCDNTKPSYHAAVPQYLGFIESGLAFIASGQVQPPYAGDASINHSNKVLTLTVILVSFRNGVLNLI